MPKKEGTVPEELGETGVQALPIPSGEVSAEVSAEGQLQEREAQLQQAEVQLQQQLDALKKELAGEHRATSKREVELQQLREELAQARSDRETQQALMAILAQQQGKSEEEFSADVQVKKPDLLAQFQTVTKAQQAQREQEKYNKAANVVWNRLLTAGVQPGDDTYFEVRSMLGRGDLDWAEAKVSKLEAAKEVEISKEPELKETEEQMRERIRQEVLRESSAFKTETGKPAGAGGKLTAEMVATMSPDERFARRKEIDAMPLG